jgi:hypothetical protein
MCNSTGKKMSSVVLCDCGSGVASGDITMPFANVSTILEESPWNCSGLQTMTERARAFCAVLLNSYQHINVRTIILQDKINHRTAPTTSDRMMATLRDIRCVAVASSNTSNQLGFSWEVQINHSWEKSQSASGAVWIHPKWQKGKWQNFYSCHIRYLDAN